MHMIRSIFGTAILLASVLVVRAQEINMTVEAPAKTSPIISKHIYGHFAEHLGRCIYDGFWVADTMKVPKKDRIRLDVVDALKRIKIPNLRWPGGCFADEYQMVSVRVRSVLKWSILTGVGLLRIIVLVRMSSWSSANCCNVNPISPPM